MAKLPGLKDVQEALRNGNPLPPGDYALDTAGGLKIRPLSKDEQAMHAASREGDSSVSAPTPLSEPES